MIKTRKNLNPIIPFIIYCVLSLFLITFARAEDCDICADVNKPVISPSGNYILGIIPGRDSDSFQFKRFQIKKKADSVEERPVVYESEDRFFSRYSTFFLWGDDDRVWVYNGDLGTFYWARIDNENWQKTAYYDDERIVENTVPAPDALKKLKPFGHKF